MSYHHNRYRYPQIGQSVDVVDVCRSERIHPHYYYYC
jgi:hypothetical protein